MSCSINRQSKLIGKMKAGPERDGQIAAMRQVGDRINELEEELRLTDSRLQEALLEVPNMPDPSVPVGIMTSSIINSGLLATAATSPSSFEDAVRTSCP